MLEWRDLIGGPAPLLTVVGPPGRRRTVVERVLLAPEAADSPLPGPLDGPLDGALVVAAGDAPCLAPDRAGALVAAAGVVVVGDRAAAERVAGTVDVPVCVPTGPVGRPAATLVWGLLLERLAGAATARAARADVLVTMLVTASPGTGAATAGGGAGRLADWCGRELGARVRVLAPDADLTPFGEDGPELAALAQGRARGPVPVAGGTAVAGGRRFPRPVLVAERAEPWSADDLAFLEQAAACAGLLSWAADAEARDARWTRAARGLRVAALQQLMAGDLVRAGRTVEPLVPGLVAAGAGTVAIVQCAPGESRSTLALAVDHAVLRRALTVLCPVSDQQVIVVHPAGAGPLDVLLAPVVAGARGRSAGVSGVTPWPRTADAYEAAVAALAEARGTPGRVAVHDGRAPLSERLGADARAWAALVAEPLAALPAAEREELLRLGQETLWWGESAGARLVGWHRHTLARRLDTLGAHTGLDRSDPWQRAALYLAVRLAGPPRPAVVDRRVTLRQALDDPGGRDWARQVLDPLPEPVRRTLAVWVDHGMRPAEATAVLGLSRSTLYKRLARAVELTHLEFTRYPGPAAEVALALHIAGDVTMPDLPDLPGAAGVGCPDADTGVGADAGAGSRH